MAGNLPTTQAQGPPVNEAWRKRPSKTKSQRKDDSIMGVSLFERLESSWLEFPLYALLHILEHRMFCSYQVASGTCLYPGPEIIFKALTT